MNCEQASQLLLLWIGRDLPDPIQEESLRIHVAACPACRSRQLRLQASMDALQSVAASAFDVDVKSSPQSSLWPRVAAALPDWPRGRNKFNGWVPAGVMLLAASLMVAVSILTVQNELGSPPALTWKFGGSSPSDGRNLFETDPRFTSGAVHEEFSDPRLLPASSPYRHEW